MQFPEQTLSSALTKRVAYSTIIYIYTGISNVLGRDIAFSERRSARACKVVWLVKQV